MDRLERTVIQLVEARRLADFDDVAHGRLALLLLDNIAETLLDRCAREALIEAGWYSNALKKLADINAAENEKLTALREELESKAVSEEISIVSWSTSAMKEIGCSHFGSSS
jgi:hypothetical protein